MLGMSKTQTKSVITVWRTRMFKANIQYIVYIKLDSFEPNQKWWLTHCLWVNFILFLSRLNKAHNTINKSYLCSVRGNLSGYYNKKDYHCLCVRSKCLFVSLKKSKALVECSLSSVNLQNTLATSWYVSDKTALRKSKRIPYILRYSSRHVSIFTSWDFKLLLHYTLEVEL